MRGGALAAVLLVACGRSEAKIEADGVVHAIDVLVAADRSAKEGPLSALEATPCTKADVCAAKEACVAAFRPMAKSARLSEEVRAAMRGGAVEAAAMRTKLEDAEAANREASEKMDGCLVATTKVRRTYGL